MSSPQREPTKDWAELQRSGVLPAICSLNDYERAYVRGLRDVNIYLGDLAPGVADPDLVRGAQRALFAGVAPWAGEFAREQMFVGGRVGAPPLRAGQEFALLATQMAELHAVVRGAVTQQPLVATRLAAFYHARFEAIHVFPDGNGRIGRLLARHLLEGIGLSVPPGRDLGARETYLDGLRAAVDQHNLAPLSDVFARATLGSGEQLRWLPAPFRIPPFQVSRRDLLGEELNRSRREPVAVICSVRPVLWARWLRDLDPDRLAGMVEGRWKRGAGEAVRAELGNARTREFTLGGALAFLSGKRELDPLAAERWWRKPRTEGWAQWVEEGVLNAVTAAMPNALTFRSLAVDVLLGRRPGTELDRAWGEQTEVRQTPSPRVASTYPPLPGAGSPAPRSSGTTRPGTGPGDSTGERPAGGGRRI